MLLEIAVGSAAALFAVWFLYPLVIAALAACRPTVHLSGDGATPRVSVILATRDDPAAVRGRVLDCLGAAYPADRLEVVVAIDHRGADLAPHLALVPDRRVRVVAGDAPGGKAAALNAGVRASHGDVLVFIDTHQRFRPDTIPLLVKALQEHGVGAASGCLDLAETPGKRTLAEWYWRYERWLRRCEARVHSSVGVTGAVSAMHRALWQPLPEGLLLDDVYTPMRLALAGHRIAFVDAARARETRRTSPAQEYRRKVRTQTGVVQLCAWLPQVLVPVRNPIWIQFVFHKLLRLFTPYWALAIVLGAAAALLAWLGATLLIAVGVGGPVAVLALRRGRVSHALRTGMLMQAAVLMATLNGVRGRWDVWQK